MLCYKKEGNGFSQVSPNDTLVSGTKQTVTNDYISYYAKYYIKISFFKLLQINKLWNFKNIWKSVPSFDLKQFCFPFENIP